MATTIARYLGRTAAVTVLAAALTTSGIAGASTVPVHRPGIRTVVRQADRRLSGSVEHIDCGACML